MNVFFNSVDTSPETTLNLQTVRIKTINVVKKGAVAALNRGPKIGGNIINTQIILYNLKTGRGTAESFLMSAAAQCVQKVSYNLYILSFCQTDFTFTLQLLLKAGCRLLEPIMAIEIVSPSDRVSPLLSDLAKRRSTILNVGTKGEFNKVIAIFLQNLHSFYGIIFTR